MSARHIGLLFVLGGLLWATAVPARAEGEVWSPRMDSPEVFRSCRLDPGRVAPAAWRRTSEPAPCQAPPDVTLRQSFQTAPVGDSACCPPRGWRFHVAIGSWLAGQNGDATINGQAAEVDFPWYEWFDNLDKIDFMLQGGVGARFGRWSLEARGQIATIGDAVPLDDVLTGAELDAEVDLNIIGVNVGYQLGEVAIGRPGPCSPCLAYEVYAGVRYWHVESDLRVMLPGGGQVLRQQETDWFDPLFGGRLTLVLPPKWRLVLEGDIGGFDVGSRFTWHVGAWADYSITSWLGVLAGWNWLGVDYEYSGANDPFRWDMVHSGPFLGLDFRF